VKEENNADGNRDWMADLRKYEDFLREIDLGKYSNLREIKTVEQDLPKEMLPLDIYYEYYWDKTDFKDFNDVFEIYWEEKLHHIMKFIEKYFYGCSISFVKEGLKARLYRIWMSILTQFHFQYLWNALFDEKLISDAELDRRGIDAVADFEGRRVGFQIKKISYRREASERRFASGRRRVVDVIVEVPYIVVDEEELKRRIESRRVRDATKERYRKLLAQFKENFRKYDNGFVVFTENYLRKVHNKVKEKALTVNKIPYDEFLG